MSYTLKNINSNMAKENAMLQTNLEDYFSILIYGYRIEMSREARRTDCIPQRLVKIERDKI